MTFAALGWLLYRLTGDPFMLGLMGFFMHIPTFLLSPFGGVLVDHVSRRKVIITTQIVDFFSISILAWLTLTGRVEVWHIMAVCLLLGITKGFEMPARMALVVDVVDDRQFLSNAIALNSTIFHGARLVGPMIAGGLLIPLAGEGVCFLVHALSYLFAMRCFSLLRPKPMVPLPGNATVFQKMSEGFHYVSSFAPVRVLLLLVTAFAMFGQSYNALLPVFAETILKGGSGTYGVLLAASGVGAVVAAVKLASRQTVLGLGKIIFISNLIFGIALILFAMSSTILLSLPLLALAGLTGINVMVGSNTIIQTLVDDHLRGRVMSFLGMVFMGALPIGSLVYGKAAELIGTPKAVMIGGVLCIFSSLIFRIRLPAVQKMVRPVYVERGILPPPPEH